MSPEYRGAQNDVKEVTSFGMSLMREYTDAKLRLRKAKSQADSAEAETAMKFATQAMANLRAKKSYDTQIEVAQINKGDPDQEFEGFKEQVAYFEDFFPEDDPNRRTNAARMAQGKEPIEAEEDDLVEKTNKVFDEMTKRGLNPVWEDVFENVNKWESREESDTPEEEADKVTKQLDNAMRFADEKGGKFESWLHAFHYGLTKEALPNDPNKPTAEVEVDISVAAATKMYGEEKGQDIEYWGPIYDRLGFSGSGSRSGSGSGSGGSGINAIPGSGDPFPTERVDKIPKLLRPSARDYWQDKGVKEVVSPVFVSGSMLRSLKTSDPGFIVDLLDSISLPSDQEAHLSELWKRNDLDGFGKKVQEYGVLGDFYDGVLSYDSLLGIMTPSEDSIGKPISSPLDQYMLSLDPSSDEFDRLAKIKSDLMESINITKKDIAQGIPTSDLVYPGDFAPHLNDKHADDPTALHQSKSKFLLDKMSVSTMLAVFMRQYEQFNKEREIAFLRGEVGAIFGNPNIPSEDKIHVAANSLRNWIAGSWSADRAFDQSAARNELMMDMMELRLIVQAIEDTGGVGTGPMSGLVNWVQRNTGVGTPHKLATHFQLVLRDAKVNYIRSEFGLSKEDAEDRLIQGLENDFFPKFREQEGYISDKLDSAIDETMGNLNEQFISQMGTDLFNLTDDYKEKHRDRIRADLIKSGILGDKGVDADTTTTTTDTDADTTTTDTDTDTDVDSVTTEPTRVEEYSELLYSLVSVDVHRKGMYSSVSEAAKDQDFQNERIKVWNRRKNREAPISRAMQAQIFESFDRIVQAEEVVASGGDPLSIPGITDHERTLAQDASESQPRYGEGGMAEFEDSVIEDQLPERSGAGGQTQTGGRAMKPQDAASMKSQYYDSVIGYQDRESVLDQMAGQASSDEEIEILSRVRRMVEFEDAFINYLNENSMSLADGINDTEMLRHFQAVHSLFPSEVKMVVDSILEGYSDEESQ